LGVDAKFDGGISEKTASYDLLLGYEKNTLTSNLDAKINQKKFGDYDITLSVCTLLRSETKKRASELLLLNKKDLRTLVGLYTGHFPLKYYLYI